MYFKYICVLIDSHRDPQPVQSHVALTTLQTSLSALARDEREGAAWGGFIAFAKAAGGIQEQGGTRFAAPRPCPGDASTPPFPTQALQSKRQILL